MSELDALTRVRRLASSGAARAIRIGAGASIREVAAVVGVSPATVHRWERGSRAPRGEKGIAYGRALDELTEAAR